MMTNKGDGVPQGVNENHVLARILVKDMYVWELIRAQLRCGRNWIFRGQEYSGWELANGAERDFMAPLLLDEAAKVKFERDLFERERENIRKFQERFDCHFKGRARPVSLIGWLALMQHYGIRTRLLDFSALLEVAMYMATIGNESKRGPFSIWGVDRDQIAKFRLTGKSTDNDEFEQLLNDNLDETARKSTLLQDKIALIDDLRQEDRNANWRIGVQHGLFIAPCAFPQYSRSVISESFIGGSCLAPLFRCPYFQSSALPDDRTWPDVVETIKTNGILEFVFPEGLKSVVRNMAESYGCCAETMCPDAKLVKGEKLKEGLSYEGVCKFWPLASN